MAKLPIPVEPQLNVTVQQTACTMGQKITAKVVLVQGDTVFGLPFCQIVNLSTNQVAASGTMSGTAPDFAFTLMSNLPSGNYRAIVTATVQTTVSQTDTSDFTCGT